jgi:hypothetical protein
MGAKKAHIKRAVTRQSTMVVSSQKKAGRFLSNQSIVKLIDTVFLFSKASSAVILDVTTRQEPQNVQIV